MAKRQWTAAQRKAQSDKLRAYNAARRTLTPTLSLRDRLIADIVGVLNRLDDTALLDAYRGVTRLIPRSDSTD